MSKTLVFLKQIRKKYGEPICFYNGCNNSPSNTEHTLYKVTTSSGIRLACREHESLYQQLDRDCISIMTPQDEYEAKTRRYSNDVIILLQLSSGNIAVYNNARSLTSVIDIYDLSNELKIVDDKREFNTFIRCYEYIRDHFWKKPVSTIHNDIVDNDGNVKRAPLNLDKFM